MARTIGTAAGKVVSAVTGGAPDDPPVPAKGNLWQAEYMGSGTFVIHKPKRKEGKRHQSRVKSRRRGMRK